MYLSGRLQWSLLAISVISGLIALVLSRGNDTDSISVETTVESTVPATTTTVYSEPVYYTVNPGDSLRGGVEGLQEIDLLITPVRTAGAENGGIDPGQGGRSGIGADCRHWPDK